MMKFIWDILTLTGSWDTQIIGAGATWTRARNWVTFKKLEIKHWVPIICVKRPSWAWMHFQGREKWRKRHGNLRKALNKRTRIKFYKPSHSLKNPGVGSLGTGAGCVSAPGRVGRKTPHKQSGWKRSRLTLWDPGPLPSTGPPPVPPTPPRSALHPRWHPPSSTSSALPGACTQGGPRTHARTFRPLAARGLPGTAPPSH